MKRVVAGVLTVAIFLTILLSPTFHPHPTGQWKSWGQFYSPSQKVWVQYMEYENGFWQDVNNTGNPFDRTAQPHYIPLSDILLREKNQK